MKTIMSAISLAIAAGFGAIRIWKIAKADGTVAAKIEDVHAELSKIISKLESYAANTVPTWDDSLADVLSGVLDVIAENVITELGG